MRGGGEGESFGLAAAGEWGGGCTLSVEEPESCINVCAKRLRRACPAKTWEEVGKDIAQACTNMMGSVRWMGA